MSKTDLLFPDQDLSKSVNKEVGKFHSVLKSIWNEEVEESLLFSNPTVKMKKGKPTVSKSYGKYDSMESSTVPKPYCL